ncbi:heat shock protein transcriptional repressor HspR [Dietzia sp. PP-33]|jgi:MerR family transcriptional regulator/heat shock protein HspR|uniref:heat shock protein transcriptional repressor HspR n=1 Tax=Dietzia sp. PP-33 TaxID=2957500 RepID=UPI0029BA0FD1|nr:helix-turn-helix transcriptional regulator [Dietzia sp. PP-33]MDX2356240.1 helix-turn-helix transcriptional regulator [Dietzia sp. PP-33]
MTPRRDVGDLGPDDSVLVISVAAELSGLHAQTLRTYDRLGIVTPERTTGGGRRYSLRDVALLREVQRLSQDEGVNLAGIKRIIELTNQVDALRGRVSELMDEVAELRRAAGTAGRSRGELVHVPRSTSVVVWRPRRERDDHR